MFRTYKQAGRQPVFSTKTVIIFHFGTSLYELRKTAAKDMFLPMLSKKRCYPAKDISSRHSHELPDKAVIHFPAVWGVVSIGVTRRRNELISETEGNGRILFHRFIERFGRIEQFCIYQLEWRNRVSGPQGGTIVVWHRTVERDHTKIMRPIHQVCPQLEPSISGIFSGTG